jgi:TetR/AcrR family transcriptional regulator
MSKKEEILNIALRLFSTKGYENCGIQQIIDEVGVKKPTLYHYFGSKRGLLEEILKTHYSELLKSFENILDKPDDIVYTLEKITRGFFNFAKKNKSFYKLYFSLSFAAEESEGKKLNDEYNARVYNFIENYFIKITEIRANLRSKYKQIAFSFFGTINNYITLYCYNDNYELTDELAYLVVKQFMYGIFSL